MYTVNVTSHYTDILINRVHRLSMNYWLSVSYLDNYPQQLHCHPTQGFLENNFFNFSDKHFHEIAVTIMGTEVAALYADVLISELEDKYVYIVNPAMFWKIFMDYMFLMWSHGKAELIKFTTSLNGVLPTIKFTHEVSHAHVPFWTYCRSEREHYKPGFIPNPQTGYVLQIQFRGPYQPQEFSILFMFPLGSKESIVIHLVTKNPEFTCISTFWEGDIYIKW